MGKLEIKNPVYGLLLMTGLSLIGLLGIILAVLAVAIVFAMVTKLAF